MPSMVLPAYLRGAKTLTGMTCEQPYRHDGRMRTSSPVSLRVSTSCSPWLTTPVNSWQNQLLLRALDVRPERSQGQKGGNDIRLLATGGNCWQGREWSGRGARRRESRECGRRRTDGRKWLQQGQVDTGSGPSRSRGWCVNQRGGGSYAATGMAPRTLRRNNTL